MKNKEIINKEKGCSTLECPTCGEIHTSYNIMNGVFQFWCLTCKKSFEGEILAGCKYFVLTDGFNET